MRCTHLIVLGVWLPGMALAQPPVLPPVSAPYHGASPPMMALPQPHQAKFFSLRPQARSLPAGNAPAETAPPIPDAAPTLPSDMTDEQARQILSIFAVQD